MSSITLKLESKGIDLNLILEEEEKELQRAIKGLAATTYDDIIRHAQDNLSGSRQDYIKSLEFQDLGNLYIISISEPGLYYENGFSPFDQKPGLLNGPRAKTTKDGRRYNIVPYGHRPSGIQTIRKGSNYRQELQKTISTMEQIVPREIRDRSGRVTGRVVAKASKEIQGYTAGMIKVEKKYKRATQSTYLTFRVASEASDPQDWLHPGYGGLKAFDAAEKMLEDRMDSIVSVIFGV